MQSSILSMDHVFLDAWKAKGIDATPVFNAWNTGNEVFVPTGPQINPLQTATDADVVAIYLNSSSVQAALDKAQADAMAAYQGKT